MKFITVLLLAIPNLIFSQIQVNIIPSNGAPCVPVIRNAPPSSPTFSRSSGGVSYSYRSPSRVSTVRSVRKAPPPIRTFVSNDGSSIQARLISVSTKSKSAKIKTDKGKIFNVPISRFSRNDIAYMKNWYNNKYKK